MRGAGEDELGGDHEVRCGDCLDPVSGMASLADKSVDHVICDPPYEAEAHTLQRRLKRASGKHDGATYAGKDASVAVIESLSFAPITATIRSAAAVEIARVTKRWVLVFCQAEAVAAWRDALADVGLVYKRAVVWVKPDGQPQLTGDRPGMGYESIVCAHVAGRSRWNAGGKLGVFTFNKNNGAEQNLHETQKPLALMEALVRDFTDPGELVLDPFAGSGTTGAACRRLGRRFLGFEKDAKYAAIAQKRIAAAREQFSFLEARGPKPKQGELL